MTSLVHWIDVPGGACSLGLEWEEAESLSRNDHLENWIEHQPHNVDSHRQAYTLLSLFTFWANIVNSIYREKPIPKQP